MLCPNCKTTRTKVVDTIPNDDDFETYRVRKCPNCNYMFHTSEYEVEYDDKFRRLFNRYFQKKRK